MKSVNKSDPKRILRQKKKFRRRVEALRGKYKGRGLLKALMAEKEHEKEF